MNRLFGLARKFQKHSAFSKGHLLCFALLGAMGANLVSNAASRSITNDEFVHIPSGHRYLVERDFTINPEHPPLAKLLASLPLLLVSVQSLPPVERNNHAFVGFTVHYSSQFWELNKSRWWQIVFWSRVPMVMLTLALGVLIFVSGQTFFGPRAALLSVALFTLEPTMLAHGWIVHTDIPAAFAYLLFFLMLGRYWLSPTFGRAMWLGVATGVALLMKFSLVIVAPIFLGALVYRAVRRGSLEISRPRQIAQSILPAICAGLIVNAGYFFQRPKLAQQDAIWVLATAGNLASGDWLLNMFNWGSKILPTYYLFGIYSVYIHNRDGHPASLLGDYEWSGWWYYFPTAFVLKTSLPFLVLTVVALRWALWTAIKRERVLIPILAFVVLYLAMAMTSRINIGVRHIAPIFPFLFLLGGAFLDHFLKTSLVKGKTILVAVMLASMVFVAVRAHPDYLSFMNSLKLKKPAWQLLSDSNVEWGQDTGAMARYLHERGESTITAALSAGWLKPHGIHVVEYPPPDLQSSLTRYVAIGAASLNGSTVGQDLKDATGAPLTEEQRVNYFAKYRRLTPEKVFGNSIYLYRKIE